MDFTTFIGIICGMFMMIAAIWLGGDIQSFLDPSSVLIVIGGTLAATAVYFPFSTLKKIFNILRVAFSAQTMDSSSVISVIVSFTEKARREGLLALEEDAEQLEEPFLQKGIHLVIDGTDPELTRNILEREINSLYDRHKAGQEIFETMGSFSPAFGMIGTLIGLIQMLNVLEDPDAIGPGMATALITTLYGVIIANLVFKPIAGKLKVKNEKEVFIKELMIEGVMAIQAGENPRIVEERLKTFLSPEMRRNLTDEDDRVVFETDAQEAVQ